MGKIGHCPSIIANSKLASGTDVPTLEGQCGYPEHIVGLLISELTTTLEPLREDIRKGEQFRESLNARLSNTIHLIGNFAGLQYQSHNFAGISNQS
jgi:hypothetical protein